MKILVNSLTIFRILAAFALIPLIAYRQFGPMFVLFALACLSDFLDGWLARKYKVTTKLGGVMDHMADKLLVTISAILLAMFLQLWVVFIPAILIICRNLYVSGMREYLGTQKVEMPVPKARFSSGKIATAAQMISIGVMLLAIFSLYRYPQLASKLYWFLIVGIVGLWVSLAASLISAAQYTKTFLEKMKKLK